MQTSRPRSEYNFYYLYYIYIIFLFIISIKSEKLRPLESLISGAAKPPKLRGLTLSSMSWEEVLVFPYTRGYLRVNRRGV